MFSSQHVLRYLRDTQLGINISLTLCILTSSGATADDVETRRSHTGFVLMMNGAHISEIRGFVHFGSRIRGGKSLRTRNCLHPSHSARFWLDARFDHVQRDTGSANMKNETPETCFYVSRKTKCTEHISEINLLIKALPVVTL